jgi:hypothetical protein
MKMNKAHARMMYLLLQRHFDRQHRRPRMLQPHILQLHTLRPHTHR